MLYATDFITIYEKALMQIFVPVPICTQIKLLLPENINNNNDQLRQPNESDVSSGCPETSNEM